MSLLLLVSDQSTFAQQIGSMLGRLDFDYSSSLSLPASTEAAVAIIDMELLLKSDKPLEQIEILKRGGTRLLFTWLDQDKDYRQQALQLGCDDYLSPVFDINLLRHRLAHLSSSFSTDQLSVNETVTELLRVQDAAILSLATIARIRDHSTGNHILRTQHYVRMLAEQLRNHPDYCLQLDEDTIELIYKTAALHDIGKVGIPDRILQKPGKLSEQEYELMKQHTTLGYQAMKSAEQLLEGSGGDKARQFLQIAQQVTLSHHEHWDGSGYPQGLKAQQIPPVARLMAVADVYDAMISRRPYKDAFGHQQAADMIINGSGKHFDPVVVEAFSQLQDQFAKVAIELEDTFPSQADLTLHSMAELITTHQ